MFESNLLSEINLASPLPTFIEVNLINSLNATIAKAFHFSHVLLAEKSTTAAAWLPWNAEIYLILQTLLEHRLLFHAEATFTDIMFGLRRGVIASPSRSLLRRDHLRWALFGPAPVPSLEECALRPATARADALTEADVLTAGELVASQSASYGHLRFGPLNTWRKYVTLFLLTLVPYIKERMGMWYAQQTDNATDAVAIRAERARRFPTHERVIRLLVRLYPVYHVLTEGLRLLYSVLFLLEFTPYTSPMNRLFGIALRRLVGSDQVAASNPRAQRALLLGRVLLVLMFLGFRLLEMTGANGRGASVGLVAGDAAAELAVPPPPQWGVDVAAAVGTSAQPPAPGMCPVCARPVTNAAVCTTSGVVGCYPCLTGAAREKGTCPVTGRSTSVDCIRRIYEC